MFDPGEAPAAGPGPAPAALPSDPAGGEGGGPLNPWTVAGLTMLSDSADPVLSSVARGAMAGLSFRQDAQTQTQANQAREALADHLTGLDSLEAVDASIPAIAQAVAMGIPGADNIFDRAVSLRSQFQNEKDKEREQEWKEQQASIDRLFREERDENEFARRVELQQNDFRHRRSILERQLEARAEQARLDGETPKPPSKTQIDSAIRADQLDQAIQAVNTWVENQGRAPTRREVMQFNAGGFMRARLPDETQQFMQSQEAAGLILGQILMGARVPEDARKRITRAFLLSPGDSPGNVALTIQNLQTFAMRLRQLAEGAGSMEDLLASVGVDPDEIGANGDGEDYDAWFEEGGS